MGNALNYSMALTGIGKQDERKLLMLGMGGAGKTSILYKLNIGQNIHPVPFTMGIDAEIFEYKKIKMIVWDMIGIRRIMKKKYGDISMKDPMDLSLWWIVMMRIKWESAL